MRQDYRDDYIHLWLNMKIRPDWENKASNTAKIIKSKKDIYEEVAKEVGLPWVLVGCIHSMESSLSMSKHLHNGDPLTARTKNVPKGKPQTGTPPFTWKESAIDALSEKVNKYWNKTDVEGARNNDIASILYLLETYNGLGYRKYHPKVKSPYLWSGSNHYTRGKYTSDGKFSSTAISRQMGAAIILQKLIMDDTIAPLKPEDVVVEVNKDPLVNRKASKTVIKGIQTYMNSLPSGDKLKVDGLTGPKTFNRFKEVFGFDMK